MEKINIPNELGKGFIAYQDSAYNCKHSIIDSIGSIMSPYNDDSDEKIVEKLKYVFSKLRIVVTLNTISDRLSKIILKNFELYGYNKVPAGYDNGFQHHFIISNAFAKAGQDYRRETTFKFNEENVVLKNSKEQLKAVITKVFKAKRRKIDIVDDILKEIV